MSLVAIPASGVPPAAERLPIRAFAQSTSATIDRGISLDSASKQSARPNLAGLLLPLDGITLNEHLPGDAGAVRRLEADMGEARGRGGLAALNACHRDGIRERALARPRAAHAPLKPYGPRPEAAPASRLNGFSAKPPHEIALALDVAQDNIDCPTSAHQP